MNVPVEKREFDDRAAAMRVLCVGAYAGTSRHRAQALARLGHTVDVINPMRIPGLQRIIAVSVWRLGGFGVVALTHAFVWWRLRGKTYDFCFVNHGETLGPALVRLLRRRCRAVACYNGDNPFADRDGARWRVLRQALPFYDVFCTVRASTAEAARRNGAAKVLCIPSSADEVVHRRRPWSAEDEGRFSSQVAFVGTWMPERGRFVQQLLRAGVPLKIFGANWRKAPEFQDIAPALVLDRFLGDEDYVRAIQYSRIALGLLSVGNRDLHTGRSIEIPVIGALFCAERTEEHQAMYVEGEEAVFWADVDECARCCLALLADPARIDRIARAGHRRSVASGQFNEPLMRRLTEEAIAAGAD